MIESYKIRSNDVECTTTIDSKEYGELTNIEQEFIRQRIDHQLNDLVRMIKQSWAEQYKADERQAHVKMLSELFVKAGFDPIFVEPVQNEYCSEPCCYDRPWIMCTTKYGRIKLGWRKRVLVLDWEMVPNRPLCEDLFFSEDVTKGTYYIHCCGYDKVVEYLKKLKGALCDAK